MIAYRQEQKWEVIAAERGDLPEAWVLLDLLNKKLRRRLRKAA